MGLFDNELQYGDRPLAVDDQGRTASCQELDVFSGGLYEKFLFSVRIRWNHCLVIWAA